MRLVRALQSIRDCAAAVAPSVSMPATKQQRLNRARFMRRRSLVAQRLDGIEAGGAASGVEAGDEADSGGEQDRERDEPPRYRPKMLRRKGLAAEINIGPEINELADDPSKDNTNDAPEDAHGSGFSEEKGFDVTVAGADGFHDADFA